MHLMLISFFPPLLSCSGDSSLTCGGPDALSIIYDSAMFSADLTRIGADVSSAAASATSAAASAAQTAAQQTIALANGFTSNLACVAEVDGRLLKGAGFSSGAMTYQLCTDFCKKAGFSQAGVEYGSECSSSFLTSSSYLLEHPADILLSPLPGYCSNDVDLTKVQPSTQCNSPCSGDSSKIVRPLPLLSILSSDPKLIVFYPSFPSSLSVVEDRLSRSSPPILPPPPTTPSPTAGPLPPSASPRPPEVDSSTRTTFRLTR
jgi:hypothetical protein